MKEHVPKCVLDHLWNTPNEDYTVSQKLRNAANKSSIAEHLLKNVSCDAAYNKSNFSILRKCRTKMELQVLESVLIATMSPKLCKQTKFDFVTSLI